MTSPTDISLRGGLDRLSGNDLDAQAEEARAAQAQTSLAVSLGLGIPEAAGLTAAESLALTRLGAWTYLAFMQGAFGTQPVVVAAMQACGVLNEVAADDPRREEAGVPEDRPCLAGPDVEAASALLARHMNQLN